MKKSTIIAGIAAIVIVSWAMPLYGVAYNRLYPSYGSALGVAYAFMLGGAVHVLAMVVWLLIRRAAIRPVELTVLLLSLGLLIVLAVAADSGTLTVFSGHRVIEQNRYLA